MRWTDGLKAYVTRCIWIGLSAASIASDLAVSSDAGSFRNPGWTEIAGLFMVVFPMLTGVVLILSRIHLRLQPSSRFDSSFNTIATAYAPLMLLSIRLLEKRHMLVDPTLFLRYSAGMLALLSLYARFEGPIGEVWRKLERRHALIFGIILFAISAAWAGGWFTPRALPTGDEPSYLMITHSIAEDRDVRMDDDYQAKAYRRFFPGKYQMFSHLGFDGGNYPHHSIGLPFLLAPVYTIAYRCESDACLVFVIRLAMGFIFVILGYQTHRLIREWTGSARVSNWTCYGIFLSGPLLFYSIEIYPETLMGLIAVLILRLLTLSYPRHPLQTAFAIGALVAYIPWLGIKYFSIATGLAVSCVLTWFRHSNRLRLAGIFLAPILISGVLYAGYLHEHYRNFNPSVIYSGVIPGTGEAPPDPAAGKIYTGIDRMCDALLFSLGLVWEQRIGLLFLAPFFLLAVPGLIHQFGRDAHRTLLVLIPILAHLAIYAWHNNWGGYCPPNRQFIAVAPLVGLLAASGWQTIRSRFSYVFSRAALFSGWTVAALVLYHPDWMYHTMNPHLSGGQAKWLRAFSLPNLVDWKQWFPLIMGSDRKWGPTIVWIILTALVITLLLRSPETSRPAPRLRLLPITPVIVVGLLWQFIGLPLNRFDMPNPPEPFSRFSYLDNNHFAYESGGFWIKAGQTAEFIVAMRDRRPAVHLRGHSLVPNDVSIDVGGAGFPVGSIDVRETFSGTIEPRRVFRRWGDTYFRIRVGCTSGGRPIDLGVSNDNRNLGVFIAFAPVEGQSGTLRRMVAASLNHSARCLSSLPGLK